MRKIVLILLLGICILLVGCGKKAEKPDLTDVGQAFPLLRMERDEVQKILGEEWNQFEAKDEEHLGVALLIAKEQYTLKELPIAALYLDFMYDSPKAILRNVGYNFQYEDLEQAQEAWKWFVKGKKEVDKYLGRAEDYTGNSSLDLEQELSEVDLIRQGHYKAEWRFDEEDSSAWIGYSYAFDVRVTGTGESIITVTFSTTPPPYGYEE